LWIDDVFVTGILAKRAGVRHHSISGAYTFTWEDLKKLNTRRKRNLLFAHLSGTANHSHRCRVSTMSGRGSWT
jgi:hypothetical protein